MCIRRRERSGFTFIELVVSLSVIAVLAALLAPMLMGAAEQAGRVACASHLHQIHGNAFAYAGDHAGMFPPLDRTNNQMSSQSTSSYMVYLGSDPTQAGAWENHGKLYGEQYVPNGDIFYCPSQMNEPFQHKSYTPWPSPFDPGSVGAVRSGYNFKFYDALKYLELPD